MSKDAFPIVIKDNFQRPFVLKGHAHMLIYQLDGSINGNKAGLYIPPIILLNKLEFFLELDKLYKLHDYIIKTEIYPTKVIHYFKLKNHKIQLHFFCPEEFPGVLIEIKTNKQKGKLHLAPHFSFDYVLHHNPIQDAEVHVFRHHMRATSKFDSYIFCYIKLKELLKYVNNKIVIPLKNTQVYITGSSHPKSSFKITSNQFLKNVAEYKKEKEDIFNTHIRDNAVFKSSDKELDKAFLYAKFNIGLLRHYQIDLGGGWFAGLPNFPEFFGRDTFWSIPGLLMLGDINHVKSAINVFTRYQSRFVTETRKIGEIPHEIWMNGEPNYYSGDSNILYLYALYYYYKWTNDLEYIKAISENIKKTINYLHTKLNKGFYTHKPEGFLPDITWMDSIDRSNAAVEIQGLFMKSFEWGSYLMNLVGDENYKNKCINCADISKKNLETYWSDAINYYTDHRNTGGSYDKTITINPVVLLVLGLVDKERAQKMFKTIKKSGLYSPFGLRTRAKKESTYEPQSYHKGSIWPFTNGLTLLAAFKYNNMDLVRDMLKIYPKYSKTYIPGLFPELIHGDNFDCHGLESLSWLQLWSSTLFVQAIIEGLFGINPIPPDKVEIKPKIPNSLKNLSLKNFKLFNSVIDISVVNKKVKVKVKKGKIEVIT